MKAIINDININFGLEKNVPELFLEKVGSTMKRTQEALWRQTLKSRSREESNSI